MSRIEPGLWQGDLQRSPLPQGVADEVELPPMVRGIINELTKELKQTTMDVDVEVRPELGKRYAVFKAAAEENAGARTGPGQQFKAFLKINPAAKAHFDSLQCPGQTAELRKEFRNK